MECIACGQTFQPKKQLLVKGNIGQGKYRLDFCECGLGKTHFEENHSNTEVNDLLYSDIEKRIRIYYYSLAHHIQVRYNQSLCFIQQFTKGKKLIEIGSNIGYTLSLARKQGFDTQGCELNDKAAKFCELVYNIPVEKDLFELDGKYDVVIMNDVLEHFPFPEMAVEKVASILNDKGVCFIQLPNNLAGLSCRNPETWMYWLPPDHTYHFSVKTLDLLFRRYGFILVWSRTVSSIEDFKVVKMLPNRIKQMFLYFMFHNQFYWPGLYEKKDGKGEFIQAIFTRDGVSRL